MNRAVVCSRIVDDFSSLHVIEREPIPLGVGDVRIRMRAASLNFPDLLMTQGKYQFKPALPFTPGMEGAGEVVETGVAVGTVRVGDQVVVSSRLGMLAEEVSVPYQSVHPKAKAMSWEEAASFPAAWLTAYVSLVRRGHLQRGETLLVHGAAGGVGMAALDLGLQLGAQVIATAGSSDKLEVLAKRGAHHVLNYTKGFKDEVKRLTQGRGADVIYDPIGGDVFDESVRCIAFDGRLLVIGFTSGRIPLVSVNMPLIKGFSVVGVRAGEYGRQFPERGRENVEAVQRLAGEGKIKPHIGLRVPLADAVEAFRALSQRRVIGKAVITF
jgi:NADPH2:quinone reductase